MLHRNVLLMAAAFLASILVGCGKPDNPWPDQPGLRVLVSFPPLYSLAANVAGDDAVVLSLLDQTGPHEFQPSAADALKLQKADVFLINGLGLDTAFANRLVQSVGKKLEIVELGNRIPADRLRKNDPHVWLGIPEAIVLVEGIRDVLRSKDPAHAAGYDRRAAELIERLRHLHEEGKAALADKQDRNIISFHDYLHYFARSFDLTVVDSIEPVAGEDPEPAHVARLIETSKKHDVRVLTMEPQYYEKAAANYLKTIRAQGNADAEFVLVDPMETASLADLDASWYERTMRKNIDNLAAKLR